MKCSKYPDRDAAGICAYSGKPYSAEELVEVQGRMYAKDNLSAVMAEKEKASSAPPMVFMNAGGGGGAAASASVANTPSPLVGTKSRGVAIVLALLLGGLGAHKFYLGQPIWGILYLLFCWTFIPSFIALIEAIGYMLTSSEVFARRYG